MAKSDDRDFSLGWTRRVAIRHRILAVNIFALLILAGLIFYLDGFRSRLTQAQIAQIRTEATIVARAVSAAPPERRQEMLTRMGQDAGARIRIYRADGQKVADSWDGAPPTYEMRDPEEEPFLRQVGLVIDNVFDTIVGRSQPPPLDVVVDDRLSAWPEAAAALENGQTVTELRRAPEGTPFVSAAARIGQSGDVLLMTVNARDIRRVVRSERLALAIIFVVTLLLSVLLSRYLARTIARPLRRLALAAHRVRLGRSREVDVPRLPGRRDEIGLLARALHDMTHSLRGRIDATEAFAADVTHELKNPLASLRSAVDSLERTKDAATQAQLLDIVRHDVNRLDRLVVEIAETSRVDAELSRARFEPVDIGALIAGMAPAWSGQAQSAAVIDFVPPREPPVVAAGDEGRLARLIGNLVDNAVSFSPPGGTVRIRAFRDEREAVVTVEDEGPGVPDDQRRAIFNRFHSVRPDEQFGRHSGLGLAIARAIAEGHGGGISVGDRPDGKPGAWFEARIPLVQA